MEVEGGKAAKTEEKEGEKMEAEETEGDKKKDGKVCGPDCGFMVDTMKLVPHDADGSFRLNCSGAELHNAGKPCARAGGAKEICGHSLRVQVRLI